MSIGTRLKNLRGTYGYSREDVSQLLRISSETLTKWEQDKGLPNGDSLVNFSKIYKVKQQDLLGELENIEGNMLQKTFEVVNRKFSNRLSKEQSPPLTDDELTGVLNKKGLLLARSLADANQSQEELDLLSQNITKRYKDNVKWQVVNALEAKKLVANKAFDFVLFTPITSIYTEQIKKAAITQPTLVRLSLDLHETLVSP